MPFDDFWAWSRGHNHRLQSIMPLPIERDDFVAFENTFLLRVVVQTSPLSKLWT